MEKGPITKLKREEPEKGNEAVTEMVTDLGYGTLVKEVDAKMPPHKKAGYMLTTFLAMGLTLSFPAKSEAQLRIGGRNLGSRITRNVLTTGKNAFEMRQNEKIIQIHAEYQEGLGKLMGAEGKLDQEYHQYKLKLREEGNEEALRKLDEAYHREKTKIMQARIKLDRERDIKLAKTKAIRGIVGGSIGTVRGY
ncbi:MAG: hypothetical protein Q7K11_01895 [Candidatus Berkelbacteria bacterium]|nr:hypothetical protein [Candidatus Berkelbacteria bacterium]